jgi:hypothetical protein
MQDLTTSLKKKSFYQKYIIFYLALTTFIILTNSHFEGDTIALYEGVQQIKSCISEYQFKHCTVVHFPIFQFIPSLFFEYLGFNQTLNLRILGLINTFSLIGIFFICFYFFRNQNKKKYRYILLLSLITSPLLWYGKSTFNEITASFLTLSLITFVLFKDSFFIVFVLSFLTGLTKETAFVFVIFLGLIAAMEKSKIRGHGIVKTLTSLIPILLGCSLSFIVNCLFNYFRYGTFQNILLLQDFFIVDSNYQRLISFLGIWISPGGGILFFWFSFFAFLFLNLFLTFQKKQSFYKLAELSLLAIVLIGLSVGFATWFSPFGWISWGPRLILPWLPSTLLLVMIICADETNQLLKILIDKKWKQISLILLLFSTSLHNVVVLLHYDLFPNFFITSGACSNMFLELLETTLYYKCLNYFMWDKYSIFKDSYIAVLNNFDVLVYSCCFLLAIVSAVHLLKIEHESSSS